MNQPASLQTDNLLEGPAPKSLHPDASSVASVAYVPWTRGHERPPRRPRNYPTLRYRLGTPPESQFDLDCIRFVCARYRPSCRQDACRRNPVLRNQRPESVSRRWPTFAPPENTRDALVRTPC